MVSSFIKASLPRRRESRKRILDARQRGHDGRVCKVLALFSLFISLSALAACANVMETQNQNIVIETPGARGAVCYLDVGGVRYKVSPPQTTNITKSKGNMTVDCLAPGNRRQKQVIEPTLSKYALGDVFTGIAPGLAWDYFSESAFKYPDIVTVDFTHTPIRPEAMPAQNAPDIRQPEEYPREEILPGRPVMNADRYEAPFDLRPREKPDGASAATASDNQIEIGGSTPGKGSLMKAVNPSGSPSKQSAGKAEQAGPAPPVPVAPGQ